MAELEKSKMYQLLGYFFLLFPRTLLRIIEIISNPGAA